LCDLEGVKGHWPGLEDRILTTHRHQDGSNRWSMQIVRPAAAIAGQIRSYCDYFEQTTSFHTRRELPHPEGVLIFNLGGDIEVVGGDGNAITLKPGEAFFAGPHLHPALSRSPGFQAGIQIDLPMQTLRQIIGAPMEQFVDQVVPLEISSLGQRLWNAQTMEQRIELLDAFMAKTLTQTHPLDARQLGALHLLRTRLELDISEVASQVGWSRKHLADRVRDAVGVGPRCFRRLVRFHALTRSLAGAPPTQWASTAAEFGYYDQSHMIREFQEFAALTPSQYMSRLLNNGGGLVEE
jgi:AraC-like DNA-binding protein